MARKRDEIAAARSRVRDKDLEQFVAELPPTFDFTAALRQPGLQIIAEVKKASPSAGVIRADFNPVAIAETYAENGAACLSVLTDEHFFQGHLDYLSAIRATVEIPILRKDFVLDRYQLLEARAAGADAVLLIAECLPGGLLAELHQDALALGLHVLVELHEAEQLDRVLALTPALLGINNRNLKTFETKLDHTLDLLPRIPSSVTVISESGIRTHADFARLEQSRVKGVLVGESLMRQPDIGAALRALHGRP
ncbi:indole-3-glycerol phosphate synthase TrpC [soil metagenome]